ncbi:hypothetical protein [Agromyces badenianii]|uniref:hypothetical protein n=1 Tax=Agromyces badenianii TaxID=2080742 RepID=UPI00105A3518|nr:hypothetical protein [Agromyces badenianii]
MQATGDTAKAAVSALKEKVVGRSQVRLASGHGQLTPDSPFGDLVAYWLQDIDLEGRISRTTEIALHDGTRAAAGDTIITRRNDRFLHAGRAWVRNGDRWTVLAVHGHGVLEVRRHGHKWGRSTLLPAEYVAEHVQLGYAVTAHRAQGLTTDTRPSPPLGLGLPWRPLYLRQSWAMSPGFRADTVDTPHLT